MSSSARVFESIWLDGGFHIVPRLRLVPLTVVEAKHRERLPRVLTATRCAFEAGLVSIISPQTLSDSRVKYRGCWN